MIDHLIQYLNVPFDDNKTLTHQKQVWLYLVYTLIIFVVGMLLFIEPEILSTTEALASRIIYITLIGSSLIGIALTYKNKIWLSANWLAAFLYLATTATLFSIHVMNTILASNYLLITAIASVFLGKRISNSYTILSIITVILLGFLFWSQTLIPFRNLINLLITMAVIFGLSSLLLNMHIDGLQTQTVAAQKNEQRYRLLSERLTALLDIEQAISATQSTTSTVQTALGHLRRLIPFTMGVVSTFSLDGEKNSIIVATTETSDGEHRPYPLVDWGNIQKVTHDEIILHNDLQSNAQSTPTLQTLRDEGFRTVLSLPVQVQDNFFGVISLLSTVPFAFTTEQTAIATQVSTSLGIALHNAYLLEAEQISRQQAETLREVANRLNDNLEQPALLDLVLDQLGHVLSFSSASIFLLDNVGLYMAARQGIFFDPRSVSREKMLSFLNWHTVQTQQSYLIVDDVTVAENWLALPGLEYIRSWLVVPLVVNDKFIGLLTLDHEQSAFYKQADADLALSFANQAAIAIEHAQLLIDLERRVEERTRELETLYQITALAGQHYDLHTILQASLDHIVETLNLHAGLVIILSPNQTQIDTVIHTGLATAVAEAIYHTPIDSYAEIIALVSQQKMVHIKDITQDKRLSLMVALQNKREALIIPIHLKGESLGALSVMNQIGRRFEQPEIKLLQSVGKQVSVSIENARLRQQNQQLLVNNQRKQLAHDIHDSVSQQLFGLKLLGENLKNKAQKGNLNEVVTLADNVQQTVEQIVKEMRLLLYNLRLNEPLPGGIIKALQSRLALVESHINIPVDLIVKGDIKLLPQHETNLFMIVQEALNNVIKHAHATRVTVKLEQNKTAFSLTIEDDGIGFDTANYNRGIGLTSMRERAKAIGASFALSSQSQNGTTISVHIDEMNHMKNQTTAVSQQFSGTAVV